MSITDSTGRQIHMRDFCFGWRMLTGPFMFKIPVNYLSNPRTLFGFILRKRHAYSSLYSRIHRRDSWIRSQLVSRRTRYASRCVITPSEDYAHATCIYIPHQIARHRGLKENQLIMVNRHPTLHVETFVVLKCKLWDRNTLGLHVASTVNMAADFDGDMVNLTMLNSYEEQAEGRILMYPKNAFVNPPTNTNILVVTQHMTYAFRFPAHLASLQVPVYFQCPSFVYDHGQCRLVDDQRPITRSHLNQFLTHIYYQRGPKEAVRIYHRMATLSHQSLAAQIRGIRFSDLMEFKNTPGNENIFMIQPRHEIKGETEKVLKILGNFTPNGYWMGAADLAGKFEQAKIARSRLTDSVTLIALSGWDFKKLAISLTDLIISYWGNVCIGPQKKSLTYDLEFYFEYLCRSPGFKEALKFALLSHLKKDE